MFKYRAATGRTPREDYLTECLAGVLQSSAELRREFFQFTTGCNAENVVLATQTVAGEAGRLDVLLEGFRSDGDRIHVAILEHKIDAPPGIGQLQRYEGWLSSQAAPARTLVYVAPPGRASGHVAADPDLVRFHEMTWPRVSHWLAGWLAGRCGRGPVLTRELLALMDEWGLTMTLNAHDLAIATAYWTSIDLRLNQVLNEVRQRTGLYPGARDNPWSFRETLRHNSCWFDDDNQDLYYYYGFDFGRQDDDWNVAQLGLPSAFFAVCGQDKGRQRFQWQLLPDGWVKPPAEWLWEEGIRVKQLSGIRAAGESLDAEYLGFLVAALEELQEFLGQ